MNIRKLILLSFAALLSAGYQAIAQGSITSPYSFIGLGDNYAKGNIRSLSMGGVDAALRSPLYINMKNPAGLSGIDSMSFVGSVGLAINNTNYRTSNMSSKFTSANINHLAIAFPVTKWWKTAVLLLPYSNVGYEVNNVEYREGLGEVGYYYDGDGGMDAISWSNAFSITPNLAVGISGSYYFGKLEHTKMVLFPDSIYVYNAMVKERIVLNGLSFEAGLQYYLPLDEKNTLGFGLHYGNKTKLTAASDYLSLTFRGSDVYNNGTVDTIRKWTKQEKTAELPFSIGGGLSWTKKDKLTLAADFRYEKWEDFQYLDQELDLSNKIRAAIGAEFIPESNNLSAYWKMVHYRVGFRYEHLGIKIADTELKEYAISLGFGLPLRKSNTMVNLGLELGQNGTIDNNLIQERYFRILVGISLKETWFRKNKYY
ncbi:MAG: hypothetical protein B7C24_05775 [Bacteroidetes bacterium 4572_77]|nr:MAG: hypothetical protein B7C24_05775 [Bacteroidetes bacterium 4572_77]